MRKFRYNKDWIHILLRSTKIREKEVKNDWFFYRFYNCGYPYYAITATNGVILNGIGTKLFGGKKALEFVHQSNRMQTDWKNVGGKKRSQK